mmetsp:Transcript_8066/g.8841  ORF Transcript_8066/g.8841 Transcript_8066/m.8841 type:complete len:186 (+) Transcript_8066:3-560(+)
MVPMDVPDVALEMMQNFVYSTSFSQSEQKLKSMESTDLDCPACPTCKACPTCITNSGQQASNNLPSEASKEEEDDDDSDDDDDDDDKEGGGEGEEEGEEEEELFIDEEKSKLWWHFDLSQSWLGLLLACAMASSMILFSRTSCRRHSEEHNHELISQLEDSFDVELKGRRYFDDLSDDEENNEFS